MLVGGPNDHTFTHNIFLKGGKALNNQSTAGVAQSVERNSHFSSSIATITNSETGVALIKEYYLKVAGSSPAFGSSPMNIIISFCIFFFFGWLYPHACSQWRCV